MSRSFTLERWARSTSLMLVGLAACATSAAEGQPTTNDKSSVSFVSNQLDKPVARFCFGTPTSVTRAGFTKVTIEDVFTPEKGYGFQSAQGLQAFDRGGSKTELPEDAYTASVYGAYRTTSDITCALIEGDSDNAFLVALPDGQYTVSLIASDAAEDPPLFEVWADGQKKLDVRIPRRAFVFMEPFQAHAAGGQLQIDLKGLHGWILSGLVVGKDGAELAEALEALRRDIFFLTESELPHWKERKSASANPPLVLTPEEQERGYVVYPVDYTEQIAPAYVPARAAIGRPLTAWATPGEFEPATFCVSAQRELGHVALELSDFVSETGQPSISREQVNVGVVRCWPQRISGWGGNGEYHVVPELIEPSLGSACRVPAGQLKQWWLTVHVPPGTPAGRYRMSLTVRPENAPPTVLEWRLLILPFSLSRPTDKHWGTWPDGRPSSGSLRGPERRGRNVPAEIDRLARADVLDYGDHGFDLVLMNYYFDVHENSDGTFTYGLDELAQDLEYLKQLGSSAPVVICFEYTCRDLEYRYAEPGGEHVSGTFSPKARHAIVGLVRQIHDEAQRRGWPQLLFFPIDEPGNNKTKNRYRFAEHVLDYVHEVPGCQTAVTVTADCVNRLGDRVDVRIYAYGHYSRDKVLRETSQGHPFWYYENGMFYAHNTLASRGLPGFEFLRSGAEVATAWGFAATCANPHNDFDGGHKDWNVVFPGIDGPVPTIYWELCREGVDDCRYVATLQQHIRQAREQGSTERAQRAESVLEPLLAADAPTIDNPLAFGRYRWRIAREILALRGDHKLSVPFAAVVNNPREPAQAGPNLIENPSFEDPPLAGGLPAGRYQCGYPEPGAESSGALQVTDEAAHSGRCSLKWDLSKVADPVAAHSAPRWLVVNVGVSSDIVKTLRGKRFKVGYWVRPGGGTTVPGMGLRQQDKEGPGEAFYYRGGINDPAVWNHFETEGRFSRDLESMDIHTWCTVPETELAKQCYFYIDDVSLQVIEEPPLVISTPLDEYYSGESIPWIVNSTSSSGEIKIALLAGERVVAQQSAQCGSGPLSGVFAGYWPDAGIYTLQVTATTPQQALVTAQRQVIVTPDPFGW